MIHNIKTGSLQATEVEWLQKIMVQTMQEHGIQDVLKRADILTVSVFLANEGLKYNDQNLFDESNMDKLLDKILQIKRNLQAVGFNKIIDDIIKNIENINDEFISYYDNLSNVFNYCNTPIKTLELDFNTQIKNTINSLEGLKI